MLLLFLEAKVTGNERSRKRKFHLWNFPLWERKFSGMKVSVINLWMMES